MQKRLQVRREFIENVQLQTFCGLKVGEPAPLETAATDGKNLHKIWRICYYIWKIYWTATWKQKRLQVCQEFTENVQLQPPCGLKVGEPSPLETTATVGKITSFFFPQERHAAKSQVRSHQNGFLGHHHQKFKKRKN